jgi:SAM-dependent methyltransferase
MLNLACGHTYHPSWTNVDLFPVDPSVLQVDLLGGLPFPDQSFDVIYHSHVIEHLRRPAGKRLMAECFRILIRGGIVRVVTPDFERLVRLYLQELEAAEAGDLAAEPRYDWLCLEIFDQLSRSTIGGEMLEFWLQNPMPAEDFVLARMGEEARQFIARFRTDPAFARHVLASRRDNPAPVHEAELHRWLYDRHSLRKLCQDAGFVCVTVCSATTSQIDGFVDFHLDTTENQDVRKPDSIFVEAVKP